MAANPRQTITLSPNDDDVFMTTSTGVLAHPKHIQKVYPSLM